MSVAPLKIAVPGKLPPGTKLISTTQGIDRIRSLAVHHELNCSLALEIDLFGAYAKAHVGERFCYTQQFGSPGLTIGLLFLCAPELRNKFAFVFRTQTETNAEIDQTMAEMEPLIEKMGIAYFRKVCGDPDAQIRVINDFEIQEPLLLSQARN